MPVTYLPQGENAGLPQLTAIKITYHSYAAHQAIARHRQGRAWRITKLPAMRPTNGTLNRRHHSCVQDFILVFQAIPRCSN
jgi:hypothetical protein